MTETNFFKSDLRELEFALFEQFRLTDLFGAPPYSHFSEEDARLILKEAHHFAKEVMGPTQQIADEKGCIHTPEGVKAPEELKAVWNAYYENGWNTLTLPEKHGGQGAPFLLGAAVMEMFNAANCAFNSYPGLTNGAAGVIRGLGSPEQRELFLTNLENGKWGGTMVLTESNAGSDVGLSTTRATPNSDGTYLISGNKIFITASPTTAARESCWPASRARAKGRGGFPCSSCRKSWSTRTAPWANPTTWYAPGSSTSWASTARQRRP